MLELPINSTAPVGGICFLSASQNPLISFAEGSLAGTGAVGKRLVVCTASCALTGRLQPGPKVNPASIRALAAKVRAHRKFAALNRFMA